MSLKELERAIEQLRAGIDATAVMLVDGRRDGSLDIPPPPIAESLGGLACLSVNWSEWCRNLEPAGEQTVTCECGERHQLHGTAVHKGRALVMIVCSLVLPDGSFEPKKALAYAEWVLAIRFFLEEESGGRTRSRAHGGGSGSSSAELAIPLSWHRKSHG